MLAVDLVEDIAHLLLCQSLGVEDTCKAVAFLLLVAKDGQNAGMEVAVAVAGEMRNSSLFPWPYACPGRYPVPLSHWFSVKNASRSATIMLSSMISIRS